MAGQRTSFVIASRNRSAELSATIERLLDSTPCPIVAVDNNSTDDSLTRARRLADRSAGRVQVIAARRNLGAVGRNVGVAACTTPYVAFCDDDSWWQPDAPALAEELFAGHPTLGLLAARTVVHPDPDADPGADPAEDPLVGLLRASPLGTRPGLPGPSVRGFLACSAVVRVAAFTAAGGFSPILHFRGEEQLLALDMAALGWELCFCAHLVAVHRPSDLRPPSATQDARSLRNAVLTTWLRRPSRQCLRAGAALLRSALRDAHHRRAALEALVRIPAVARQRRRLPERVEREVQILEAVCSICSVPHTNRS